MKFKNRIITLSVIVSILSTLNIYAYKEDEIAIESISENGLSQEQIDYYSNNDDFVQDEFGDFYFVGTINYNKSRVDSHYFKLSSSTTNIGGYLAKATYYVNMNIPTSGARAIVTALDSNNKVVGGTGEMTGTSRYSLVLKSSCSNVVATGSGQAQFHYCGRSGLGCGLSTCGK